MQELLKKASQLSSIIVRREKVLIVTHIDADGITSGSIAFQVLERAGIEKEIIFVKQLDERTIEEIKDRNEFVWFTDLGSGQIRELEGLDFVITDHHVPIAKHEWQLNPHDFGYDGTVELSGATATYLVARKFGLWHNYDLSALAIVGAVGDLQDSKYCKLIGLNTFVVREAVEKGFINVKRDLRFFGKQTRPVVKLLEYTFEPYLPGVSGDEDGTVEFLSSLGIDPWKKWIELSKDERRTVVSAIVSLCIEYGLPYTSVMRIVGDSYILLNEEEGTEKRDAMEYSTLLNATARYGEAEVGLNVCLGDADAYRRARYLLQNHRRNLSNGLKLVDEMGIAELKNIQYFHAEGEIPDTIVGIVAGMCFHKANRDKPIIAFANNEDGVKVSARATYRLVERGVHLAQAVRIAAERVGGSGGGHSVAAGATIPEGKEEEFLNILDEIIGKQLS